MARPLWAGKEVPGYPPANRPRLRCVERPIPRGDRSPVSGCEWAKSQLPPPTSLWERISGCCQPEWRTLAETDPCWTLLHQAASQGLDMPPKAMQSPVPKAGELWGPSRFPPRMDLAGFGEPRNVGLIKGHVWDTVTQGHWLCFCIAVMQVLQRYEETGL